MVAVSTLQVDGSGRCLLVLDMEKCKSVGFVAEKYGRGVCAPGCCQSHPKISFGNSGSVMRSSGLTAGDRNST